MPETVTREHVPRLVAAGAQLSKSGRAKTADLEQAVAALGDL